MSPAAVESKKVLLDGFVPKETWECRAGVLLIIEGKLSASCQKAWERINAEIHFVATAAARFH